MNYKAYLVKVDTDLIDPINCKNSEFIDTAVRQESVYTLAEFGSMLNNQNINMDDYYVRFLETPVVLKKSVQEDGFFIGC